MRFALLLKGKTPGLMMNICLLFLYFSLRSQNIPIREYRVTRVDTPMTIDGRLDEKAWQVAPYTEYFVDYADGSLPLQLTRAQLVWDDNNLYVAFTAIDHDIWATKTRRDAGLWKEEAVELFIDPDGDEADYIELQINPLGTICDILLHKEFSKGGHGDYHWTFEGLTAAVAIHGTLNDDKEDTEWICEIALPFQSLKKIAPSCHSPPRIGDLWRINLCRMESDRFDRKIVEATAWNQTDIRGFHAPNLFGRITFVN